MEPKVSVIIPVYNVEKYLEDCINSIQKQTLAEIEIVCVNDGSTDSSLSILKRLAKDDPRIVLIDQKNAGAGAARNNGIRVARGTYIGFVDSDDLIYPNMYEDMYKKATEINAEMVISGEIETFFNENIYFPLKSSETTVEELELAYFTAAEYPEILQNVFLWNRIYSREFWFKHNLQIPENRKFAEDLCICTQTSVLAERIGYVRGPHYRYRNFRENSLSDTLAKSAKKLDYLVAVQETKDFLMETGAYSIYAQDFLCFSTFLFILLQKRLSSFKYHKEFFCGMANILDEDDFSFIEKIWISNAFPKLIRDLKKKKNTTVWLKNIVLNAFHL